MMKYLFILLVIFLNIFPASVYCEDIKKQESLEVVESFKGNKICPVFSEEQPTDERYYYEFEGEKIYFCCHKCVEYFQKNPKHFMKRFKKMQQKTIQDKKEIEEKDNEIKK